MHILIVASSGQPQTLENAQGLVTAAVNNGHWVSVFFYMDAVSLLKASEAADRLDTLSSSGVKVLICRTSAKERGIDAESEVVEGAKMSSLGELVEMLDDCDRALFLG